MELLFGGCVVKCEKCFWLRCGLLLLVVWQCSPQQVARAVGEADDLIVSQFEAESYLPWKITGDAFGKRPARGKLEGQQDVAGFRGKQLVNTFLKGDSTTGTLTSPPFKIQRDFIVFLLGGGNIPDQVGVELLLDGKRILSATAANDELLSWVSWDVKKWHGETVEFRVFDYSTGGFGHINVDEILQSNRPRRGAGTWRLEDYRASAEYYQEPLRPQVHFSPELNWMNDPNGLVYFDGEYHLFYQHNPLGNNWGHMSWGHAVSKDLVHWQHLPIALHHEYGVMAFSGCAVVDWNNTTGFGKGDTPPLVAIFTGHGHGRQTQDLAYSTDRGRNWTRYAGNPVIDIGEADFRDPKVFWHRETEKWVMVVALAKQKKIQFYGSANLKQWSLLSEFGPAGAPGKPNWECPDLFELPVEGEPGQSRWILEVDMGGQAVAGGSGGEYFIGQFDGTKFVNENASDVVLWVDYGTDFYAPVSWSDIPAIDGRRIWIGWMNNWETSQIPTRPWKGSMSVPRSLRLKRIQGELRLVQTPVEELKALRQQVLVEKERLEVDGEFELVPDTVAGRSLELTVDVEVTAAKRAGLKFVSAPDEITFVFIDDKKQLVVDRSYSGTVNHIPEAMRRHQVRLPDNQSQRLRIIWDRSSLEVFAADGSVVMTTRIFPTTRDLKVQLFGHQGEAVFENVTVWPLESIWNREAK